MECVIEYSMQASAKHCDRVATGPQVGSVQYGFPVSKQFAPTLRYWVRRHISEAGFQADLKKYAVKTQCMANNIDPEGQTGTQPGIFAGPFAVLFVSAVCAIAWAVWARYRRHRQKKAAAMLRVTLQGRGYVPCDSADQIVIGASPTLYSTVYTLKPQP